MDGFEGSNEVDEGSLPFSDTESETVDEEEQQVGEAAEQPEQEEQPPEGETEYTDKGTKKDPNPMSALNQELANYKRTVQNYETVLKSPELLKQFAKEMGISLAEAKEEIKEQTQEAQKDLDFSKISTKDDFINALSTFNGKMTEMSKTLNEQREENKRLQSQLAGINQGRVAERIASNINSDVTTIKAKYPELNPKSPQYDKDLEEEIGSFYLSLDAVDPTNPARGFKGQYSLAQITDKFMKVRGLGRKQGEQSAQTTVQTKLTGRVVTADRQSTTEKSNISDPGTSIARKIAKMVGN